MDDTGINALSKWLDKLTTGTWKQKLGAIATAIAFVAVMAFFIAVDTV